MQQRMQRRTIPARRHRDPRGLAARWPASHPRSDDRQDTEIIDDVQQRVRAAWKG